MMIGITGATGFIGRRIVELARERGHEVIAFSRHPERSVPGCAQTRAFRVQDPIDVTGCDAIIHLAGENVFGIWTAEKRRRIRQSRVQGTRNLINSIRTGEGQPRVLVSASGVGFYGDTGDNATDESGEGGEGFLAEVSKAWESEASWAEEKGMRVVLLRTGMVLGPGGGALAMLIPLFRAGLGGDLASGKQWMSWIHLDDEARLALFAVENETVRGPLNLVAPQACRNSDFTDALSEILDRPAPFRVPAWPLRVALGGFSRELLENRRIVPRRALDAGFEFLFPDLREALQNATGRDKD